MEVSWRFGCVHARSSRTTVFNSSLAIFIDSWVNIQLQDYTNGTDQDQIGKTKKVVDVQLVKVSFGNKCAPAPTVFYNPVPPNKRLIEPSEQERCKKNLEAAHAAALVSDTSGNVQRYGSSTWLTALQTDCDSSSGSKSDD